MSLAPPDDPKDPKKPKKALPPPEEASKELAKRGLQQVFSLQKVEDIKAELFDKQRAFLEDPSRRKAALCTRRAGKTNLWSRYGTIVAITQPKSLIRIWASSRLRAKQLLWDEFKDVAARHRIAIESHETELTIRYANGSEVRLLGADKDKEAQKKRGDKTSFEVILETQSFGPFLKTLIEDVIEPCLFDTQGTLCLEGTPGPLPTGFWFNVTGGETKAKCWVSPGMVVNLSGETKELVGGGWSCHRWSLVDNPYIDQWRGRMSWRELAHASLEALRKKKNWTLDNPTYVREYTGQWVKDEGVLYYKFGEGRNTYTLGELQPWGPNWKHVLGWDLGAKDDMALVVWGWHPNHKCIYEAFSWKKPGARAAEVVEQIDKLEGRGFNIIKKVADTGGGGRMFVEEVMSRYSHVFEAAKKTDKYEHSRIMNDDFLTGKIKLQRGSAYADEIVGIMKDPDWDEFSGVPPGEDPRCPNHCSDAGLYSFRWVHQHLDFVELNNDTPDKKWDDAVADLLSKNLHKKDWWEPDGDFDEFGNPDFFG